MKRKVIFDARWEKSGGIGRFCKEIMKAKSLDGYSFLKGELSEALSVKDLFTLSKITFNGDFFISPGYNCPFFSMDRSIITLHDLMHLNFPEYLGLKNKIYYNFIVKRAIRSSPLVFTVSEFTRQEIAVWANISIEKISVVPNGVDHKFYNTNVVPIFRKRPYFFYVGNNKPHKNLIRLIQAYFQSGLQNEIDLLLSCSSTPDLDILVKKLGLASSVSFLSGIDEIELPSYYKGALATVVVALYEGFCLPILESMAVGTPVITSNITAMPETAGKAALLVDPYDVTSISQSLNYIFDNQFERTRLVDMGLNRAQMFSWERSRKIWDQSLNNILKVIHD